jgi:diguanylate cyclase (GGDEF)-like protein
LELDRSDFEELCAFGTRMRCRQGQLIFRRGAVERSMYFVLSGEVALEFPGDKPPKRVGPGGFFGELAFLIGEHARSASAIALRETDLVVADQQVVDRLLQERPRLLFSLLRGVCGYLFGSEQTLIADLQARNEELQRAIDYLRRTREELSHQELAAQTDALTGLYNRRCLDEQLPKALERARATESPVTLAMIDLDGFKRVNDTLGHPAGDAVLRRMARLLTVCTRKTDLPCRLGGDEFAVILPEVAEERAGAIAEALRAAVELEFVHEKDQGAPVTCSVGLASAEPEETGADLLGRADGALYEAKRQGRNRVARAGARSQG